MNLTLFAPLSELLGGLFVGILFGFLLQKATVTRFNTIVGQLLLKDFTVMKVILTAIATGSLGLYGVRIWIETAPLLISTTTLLAALLGGGLFGCGMALLGYCPGTCVGAAAEPFKDARFGLLGMLVGAGLYAEAFPWITAHIKPHSAMNKSTLSDYFHFSPWLLILPLLLVVLSWIWLDRHHSIKHARQKSY